MKRKAICLIIWVLLSATFIWYLQDSGRRTGSEIQDYLEFCTEKNEKGTETSAEVSTRNFIKEELYNMSEWFRIEDLSLGFVIVIYVSGTMVCCYFGNKKEREK